MHRLRRSIIWVTLAAIWALVVLSVAGGFAGAARAKAFFNSIPLGVYWCVLLSLLVTGLVVFPRLVRKPGLFLIHAGCLLVLAGGIWGSEGGHRLAKQLLGGEKIPKGYLVIYEGHSEKHVLSEDLRTVLGELPFSIMLEDFRLEYYEEEGAQTGLVWVETEDGERFELVARVGEECSLGEGQGKVMVMRIFRHFRIRMEDGAVTDDERDPANPAVEVEVEGSDGRRYTRYVFERFPGFSHREDDLRLSYLSRRPGLIRDFYSDIVVIESGERVVWRTIEVNYPLHYGGYHFYQHSYDADRGEYTILSVTSDSGLYAVFGGYWMLSLGAVWHFWFGRAAKRLVNRRRTEEGA